MVRRHDLQDLLETTLGSSHVYFQPPPNVQMQYPCIVYKVDNAHTEFAGNKPYMYKKRYQVTAIDRDADSTIPDRIAMLESAIFDRYYPADNLHHSVFTLYF